MSKHTILIAVCALALSACTSIRVTGFVTNERTGDPAPGAESVSGSSTRVVTVPGTTRSRAAITGSPCR